MSSPAGTSGVIVKGLAIGAIAVGDNSSHTITIHQASSKFTYFCTLQDLTGSASW